jgi:hypothetical protein
VAIPFFLVICLLCWRHFGEFEFAAALAVLMAAWVHLVFLLKILLEVEFKIETYEHDKDSTSFNYHLITTEATEDALGS